MEDIRIDSHKLMFHPDRVAAWQRGETVYPIYTEVSPTGACNHRCVFCAKDFVGYRPTRLEAERYAAFIGEMARAGLRSVMFAGEGEPCLHPDIAEMARETKAAGVDIAMTTNGSRVKEAGLDGILGLFSWIRFSMNAGRAATYAKIHGCAEKEFDRVVENLRLLCEARDREAPGATVGVQCLLLPDNEDELLEQAELVRDIGVDYFTIKPFNYHPKSGHDQYAGWRSTRNGELSDALDELRTDSFNVLFRAHAIDKISGKKRSYQCCHALPFWSYLDSKGDLYGCSTYLGDERFNYGNMYENTFEDIWNSERKRALFADLEGNVDLGHCRWGCRMDEVNQYLWDLAHPGRHVNFI